MRKREGKNRLLDYFIWYNWLANFGRGFSCGSTWLFLR